jgi:hypothetical protein
MTSLLRAPSSLTCASRRRSMGRRRYSELSMTAQTTNAAPDHGPGRRVPFGVSDRIHGVAYAVRKDAGIEQRAPRQLTGRWALGTKCDE